MSDKKESKIFYGWFVVGACFFVTLSLGETMWSFGVFFKPLQAEFHWSRTLVSSGYTAFLIAYSLSSIVSGRLSDRYGPRPILLANGVLVGLGMSLCSLVQSVNELRLFLFVAGIGAGGTWSVPTATVQRWFRGRKRAGLALSIVVSAIGLGALIFAPLINYLILNYGWRNAFLLSGTLFFILILAAAPFVKRAPAQVRTDVEGAISTDGFTQELPINKILVHSSFLILNFAGSIPILAFQVLSVHLVPFATDLGIAPTTAAATMGLMGAFSVPGRLLAGPISDRIGWKKTFALSIFGLAFAHLWLFFSRSEWMLYGFALVFGLFWGCRATSMNGAVGSFFGMRYLGQLIGINGAVCFIPSAIAPYIAGYIYDTFGSYVVVFASLNLLLLVAGVLAIFMKRPVIAGSEERIAQSQKCREREA